ncbi:MAG TPA: DNA methyltransferase, partial [Holophaga sp.]|nr:DNA methyltransferase [Holophaga sp.]
FLAKAFACMVAASRPNAPWYVWHSFHGQREFQSALELVGLTIRAQIIWVKPSAGLGNAEFRSRHENAFVAGRDGQDVGLVLQEHGLGWFGHRLGAKPPTWLGERKQTSVWECGRDSAKALVHATQKPVDLLLRAMRLSSLPRNLVLDLFAGSGSTLAACEASSRRCHCLELDEAYTDVIVRRWQHLTGRKATLLRDGKELSAAMPKEKK